VKPVKDAKTATHAKAAKNATPTATLAKNAMSTAKTAKLDAK
jgi:hypothetical protein